MEDINKLYDLTQLYFFDFIEAEKIFNEHYEYFTQENEINRKKFSGKTIFDYLIKGISPATKEILKEKKLNFF